MPPRRVPRHRDIEDLYRREEATQMETRLNEKFDEGIDRLERLMLDMNQNQRRTSPISNRERDRVSPVVSERGRESPFVSPHSRQQRRDSPISERRNDRGHRSVDNRGRRNVASRVVGGHERQRYSSDEEYERGSVHYRNQTLNKTTSPR